jgi:hypothetical protein
MFCPREEAARETDKASLDSLALASLPLQILILKFCISSKKLGYVLVTNNPQITANVNFYSCHLFSAPETL